LGPRKKSDKKSPSQLAALLAPGKLFDKLPQGYATQIKGEVFHYTQEKGPKNCNLRKEPQADGHDIRRRPDIRRRNSPEIPAVMGGVARNVEKPTNRPDKNSLYKHLRKEEET